jgi:transcriptional coactivator HFI1/ADA1
MLTRCQGHLNQAEMSWVLQPLLIPALPTLTSGNTSPAPQSTLHLHNILIACLYANIQRDPPPSEVAPWVVATDKPTTASKAAGAVGANDKAEERLKREVMSIHARDRRRIKALKGDANVRVDGGLQNMLDYQQELEVKQPEVAPSNAATGGLAKTNWDLEIHRKYAQPLAAETLEFPSLADVQARIEPICYEEGLSGGATGALQSCAELVEQAAEVFIKELLSDLVGHSRSNGEGCIQTSKYRRQLRREEEDAERGILQRNAAGLLPVGILDQAGRPEREPLDAHDLRLALQLQDRHFKQEPFLSDSIMLSQYPDLSQPARHEGLKPLTNGALNHDVGDPMIVDEDDWGWQGGSLADHDVLMGVLDDCLDITA